MTCYYPNDSAPWRGRDRRSTEKPRGLCVPVMLFSRKGKPASRNSSRRFFADRILTKPYADWVDGTFSRNFTGFGKERENVSAKRWLAQDNALPFSHRLSANFSQFFSQIAFPETLVFTGFRALFLTISQFLWRRENFLRLMISCFDQKKKAILLRIAVLFSCLFPLYGDRHDLSVE